MIHTLLYFVLMLALLGIFWWALNALLPLLPIAEPFATVIRVALIVIAALIVLSFLFSLIGGPSPLGPLRW